MLGTKAGDRDIGSHIHTLEDILQNCQSYSDTGFRL